MIGLIALLLARMALAGDFDSFAITPETLRDRITNPAFDKPAEDLLANLKFERNEPGLRATGYAYGEHVTSARAFADLFYKRYGLTLVLAKRLGRRNTPIYSGLILDDRERIVANFRLLNGLGNVAWFVDEAARAAKKIERYSRQPESFLRLAFEDLRQDFGYARDEAVDTLWTTNKRLRNHYWHVATHARRVRRLFAPGRPTWLLIDMDSYGDFTPAQAGVLRQLTAPVDRVLRRVILIQPDRVITIHDGRSEVHDAGTCEIDLSRP